MSYVDLIQGFKKQRRLILNANQSFILLSVSVGINRQLGISASGICPIRYHVSHTYATHITYAHMWKTHTYHVPPAAVGHLFLSLWPMSSVTWGGDSARFRLRSNICHT